MSGEELRDPLGSRGHLGEEVEVSELHVPRHLVEPEDGILQRSSTGIRNQQAAQVRRYLATGFDVMTGAFSRSCPTRPREGRCSG